MKYLENHQNPIIMLRIYWPGLSFTILGILLFEVIIGNDNIFSHCTLV